MPKENDDYESMFNKKSIENVLALDKIYPTFKAEKNVVYKAIIIENAKAITTKLGKAYAMLLDINGMVMSFIAPKSFLFNLTVERMRNNLSKDDLIGKIITFIKSESKHKEYGISEMYSVNIEI